MSPQDSRTNQARPSQSDADISARTTPPSQPVVTQPETVPPTATPLAPLPASRKKLVIGMIAAAAGLLIIGSGVAFAVWHNSPQTVLNDSFSHLLSSPPKRIDADASISVSGSNFKIAVTSSGDDKRNSQANVKFDVTSGGTAVNANIDAIAANNGDLYLRVNDSMQLLDQFTQGSPEFAQLFAGVVQKFDSKWVMITRGDIKNLTGDESSPDSACVNDAVTAFEKSDAQQKEVRDIFVKNQFITVKEQKADETVDQRDSYHYVLNTDSAKAKSFGKGLERTQVYKKIKSCLGNAGKDNDNSRSDTGDDTVSSAEIWIDKANRQIMKLSFTSTSEKDKGKAQVEVVMGYGSKAVSLPASTTSLQELQQELQKTVGRAESENSQQR